MVPAKSERFEMRVDEEILRSVDVWRAEQDDYPTRAEAMRRLVDLGLSVQEKKESVSFTDGEKLILLMLRDLFRQLKITSEVDPEFIAEVIWGGHYWAARWALPGVFHNHEDDPRNLTFVLDVMSMWDQIELGYSRLTKSEKAQVAEKAEPLGKNPKFMGFDGNNESELVGIARFLVEKMERFSRFKDRDMNAHMPTRAMHQRMLDAFERIEHGPLGMELGVKEIVKLLQAQIHPTRRSSPETAD